MRIYELLASLLIILLCAFGVMRGLEFIIRGESSLQEASDIYIKLSQYADIQTIGWLLVIFSIILLCSIFVNGKPAFVFLIIGGIVTGTIHICYGMIAVDTAKVISTYYTTLTIGLYQYILMIIGVIGLWKTAKKKD